MAKQAKALTDADIKKALKVLDTTQQKTIFLLSAMAGLRAKEIAMLRWEDADLYGRTLELKLTKGDKARRVPIGKELHEVLQLQREEQPEHRTNVVTNNHNRPGAPLTPNAVAQFLRDLYTRRLNWTGYSSHSGRRGAITKWARRISSVGGSLKDVQALAGHADLQTTSRYIEVSEDAQKRLVE